MAWYTQGEKNSPVDGTLLADTGQLISGTIYPILLVTGTALTSVKVQHRNASNNGNIAEFKVKVPLNDTVSLSLGGINIDTANERVRIVTDGALVGSFQAVIAA